MSSPGRGSIGALDYTPEERRVLARKSQTWECEECGPIVKLLNPSAPQPPTQDEREIMQCIDLKAEENAEKVDAAAPSPSSDPVPEAPPAAAAASVTATPQIRVPLNLAPERFGRLGDFLLVVLVAAIALLITRRMALSMFL